MKILCYQEREETPAVVALHSTTILSRLFPGTIPLSLEAWHVEAATAHSTLHIISMAPRVLCPSCAWVTQWIHRYYTRTLAALPWATHRVTWPLRVRKFFCDHPPCRRQLFTEHLPDVAAPWARQTIRCAARQTAVALGGAAGAWLSHTWAWL